MKTLKLVSQDGTIDVEYLVDLIGSNDQFTIYDAKQIVSGIPVWGINAAAIAAGLPDKNVTMDKIVSGNGATHTPLTLTWMIGFAASKNYTLTILEEGQAPVTGNQGVTLAITTEAFDAAEEGQAFSQQLAATGGAQPYVFSTASTLPDGITLSSAGLLAGTPTEDGTFALAVTVTDAVSGTDTLTANLVVAASQG
jgi:hypothetical protein